MEFFGEHDGSALDDRIVAPVVVARFLLRLIEMKLRTTATSIRLRLSQTDVRNFAEHGVVEETLKFDPEGKEWFVYRLVRDQNAEGVLATFANNQLTVSVPVDLADDWTSTEVVGINNDATNAQVQILVEKDFTCLAPRVGEDDRDTFPHPQASQNC